MLRISLADVLLPTVKEGVIVCSAKSFAILSEQPYNKLDMRVCDTCGVSLSTSPKITQLEMIHQNIPIRIQPILRFDFYVCSLSFL